MNRVAFLFLLTLLLAPKLCLAIGTEEKGNRPLSERNYTDWKGIIPIVNDKSRVYQVWVNGNEYLCYKGKTRELNATLATFAKVDVKNHVVVMRPGPADRHSFDKTPIPFNWEIHLIGGIAKSRATDDIEDLEWQRDPVLTIYVTDDIDLGTIEIPEGLTLRSAPPLSQDAKMNEDARKKIANFFEQRKRDTED
jgi:hypothetical protein